MGDEVVEVKAPYSQLKAIREFFEKNGGRKTTIQELKALTEKDKEEMAPLCAKELGVELLATHGA